MRWRKLQPFARLAQWESGGLTSRRHEFDSLAGYVGLSIFIFIVIATYGAFNQDPVVFFTGFGFFMFSLILSILLSWNEVNRKS